MNVHDAQICMRAPNFDGGEGSGVKGHTTEHIKGVHLAYAAAHANWKAAVNPQLSLFR